MEKEIEVGNNRMIFDFMEFVHSDNEAIDLWEMSGLQFHNSWSVLMPVVEKIESMYHEAIQFYIKDKRAYIDVDTQAGLAYDIPEVPECYSGFCDTKIEAVYSTVLSFIQWYNEQNK